MNKHLEAYIAGAQSPKTSGFEHLQTLMLRDKLFEATTILSSAEKAQLRGADRQLLEQAVIFLEEMERITSLEYERQQRTVSPLRWWWYLDVIVNLSLAVDTSIKRSKPAEMALA